MIDGVIGILTVEVLSTQKGSKAALGRVEGGSREGKNATRGIKGMVVRIY